MVLQNRKRIVLGVSMCFVMFMVFSSVFIAHAPVRLTFEANGQESAAQANRSRESETSG